MRLVVPLVPERRHGDRSGRRPQFRAEGERVGLQRHRLAVRPDDLELVGTPLADIRHEDFPDAGIPAQAHDMAAAVPVVEIADHGDAARVRRPDGEMHA